MDGGELNDEFATNEDAEVELQVEEATLINEGDEAVDKGAVKDDDVCNDDDDDGDVCNDGDAVDEDCELRLRSFPRMFVAFSANRSPNFFPLNSDFDLV